MLTKWSFDSTYLYQLREIGEFVLIYTIVLIAFNVKNRACYSVLRFVMESGARGCEIVVSGKLRGQRAKAMKFVDGLMIHSGDPVNQYVQRAVKHVELRQGVLGIKIKIMLSYDPSGECQRLSVLYFI